MEQKPVAQQPIQQQPMQQQQYMQQGQQPMQQQQYMQQGQQPMQQQYMQQGQQPMMYQPHVMNPCCCDLKCGVRAIAIVNIVLWGISFIFSIVALIGSSSSTRPRSSGGVDILGIVLGIMTFIFAVGLIVSIILLIGAEKTYGIIITIICLVLDLFSLSVLYEHKSWSAICVRTLLTFYFLLVVYCYIKEIKAYPNGKPTANMQYQGQMGMPAQQLPYGTGYQQMPAQQSQQGYPTSYPTNQPYSNPNPASTTASSTNASGSASASAV